MGSITDAVAKSQSFAAVNSALSPEQIGFNTGMLAAALFPLCLLYTSFLLAQDSAMALSKLFLTQEKDLENKQISDVLPRCV